MNVTRPLLLCTSAQHRDLRRKQELPLRCSVGCHHPARKRSWADAATSAQPSDNLPARARTRGATLAKTSALPANNNPRAVTGGYQTGPIPVTTGTLGHLASIRLILFAYRATGLLEVQDRPSGIVARIAAIVAAFGDIVFLANDEEACRWGWTIERRHGGLGRRYRHPRFDTLATCGHCRGLGITAAESWCVACAGTGRVTIGQPPVPHDG